MNQQQIVLRAEHVSKSFPVKSNRHQQVKAVSDVSLALRSGETYGLVGESGCGKSTLGRVMSRLIPLTTGQIYFGHEEISGLSMKQMQKYRRHIQMVFQDCYASLDPRRRVGDTLSEVLAIHNVCPPEDRMATVIEMMSKVGLRPEHYFRYPHEFSGGQRQRIGLARALILHPDVVICDEPVSALDVSIQSQILNLLLDLQERGNHCYLFIAHDMSVVKHISDRIGVMYLGHLVEEADTEELFRNTLHPYTAALLSAVPTIEHRSAQRTILEGEIPSPIDAPSGCVFHTRCPRATAACARQIPALTEVAPGHKVACLLYSDKTTHGKDGTYDQHPEAL